MTIRLTFCERDATDKHPGPGVTIRLTRRDAIHRNNECAKNVCQLQVYVNVMMFKCGKKGLPTMNWIGPAGTA